MKNQRVYRRRLWVEELEPRVVMSASPGGVTAPLHSVAVTSTNWAGYASEVNLNSFKSDINTVTAVSGSWTVPAVTGTGTAYSSIWVGIDGYDSNTVEQIGTDSDIVNGQPQYYAWYEMYPKDSVSLTKTQLPIDVGHSITASVVYNPTAKTYLLSLTDNTTKSAFSITQTLASAQRSSAEWIVEAPSSGYGILPLANFGSVTITGASATISGIPGPIDNTNNASINLIGSKSSAQALTTPATPFNTTAAGVTTSSFTVKYVAPVAPPPPTSNHHHWFGTNSADTPLSDVPATPQVVVPQAMNPVFASFNAGAPASGFVSAPASQRNNSIPAIFPFGGSSADDLLGDNDVNPNMLVPMRPAAAPGAQPMQNQQIPPAAPRPMQQDMPPCGPESPVSIEAIGSAPVVEIDAAESRSGSVLKPLISLLGSIGAFCLFHGGWRTRSRPVDDREQFERAKLLSK